MYLKPFKKKESKLYLAKSIQQMK